MHTSAHQEMRRCIDGYMPRNRHYTVLDFGAFTRERLGDMTHRTLLADRDCEVIGVDIRAGCNVDLVMAQPYRLPMRANSVDIVLAGQVFEHVPFFWASMLEIARVLKPRGFVFVTVPSRGHVHTELDCWRYYPDGMRAMAAFAGLRLREARTDFPPGQPQARGKLRPGEGVRRQERHRYDLIDLEDHYWGDTVGVFQKPRRYPATRMRLVRLPLLWWADRQAEAALPRRLVRRDRRRREAAGLAEH